MSHGKLIVLEGLDGSGMLKFGNADFNSAELEMTYYELVTLQPQLL